ncbi:MAG: hypothetical protein IAE77_18925 [Prosthecobacter sp.]|uniref:DUF6036 family nucleotidyltransferase n=1 Tax=Prosthecobacter sp. TaxID=1965333 RepID=UPI0019FA51CD|nr:DUF6036 family nucleotidyltransferase [Prosthecobacter sp.]MBE2285543.1 hypothetical protein [Prosthecobacter sp.]
MKDTTTNNPADLMKTLDGFLDHEVSLVVYGRGALCLGYEQPLAEFLNTQDVDGIIRAAQLDDLVNDERFWNAVDATNQALEPRGLYITHLFQEDQVFLRPEWEAHIVPVLRPPTRWLKLFRPHTIDLILTKMMRGNDPQDMADVDFLIRHDHVTAAQMEPAFATVRMPDIQELRDAFQRALPVVRQLLARHS